MVLDFLPLLLDGAATTALIGVLAAVLSLVLAVPAGLARAAGSRPVQWLAIGYIEFFRGTSLIVQLFWLYFVLPQLELSLPALAVAVLGLGLNYGAYGAEIVRGAVAAVDHGQIHASRSLGLTTLQTYRLVILPQALILIIRPWGNLMIQLLKATSLVSLITIADLSYRAYQLNQLTMRTTEIFGVVLVLYFLMAQVIALATDAADRRTGRWRLSTGHT